jgi:hypothetical protein
MSTLGADHWTPILSRLNSLALKSNSLKEHLTPEVLSTCWCGLPPAPENEILETERRLGIRLPPSYRSFLSVSNGWRPFDSLIERLLPVQQIDRLRFADPEATKAIQEYYQEDELSDEDYLDYADDNHMVALRHRFYPESVLVGKGWPCESELILLNPRIVFPDGEWEAIFFADWLPGNERYRSFRVLVEAYVNNLERA